jgi:plastocyanin
MRKPLLFLIAVLALATGGAAAKAATQTVTISAKGYSPTAVSITVGDSVVFANSDAVAHTVDFKQTTGVSCTGALPLALPAGQSASCTFSSTGKFTVSDPAHNGNNFRATITVAASATTGALTITPTTVVYGHQASLAGTISSKQAGQSVQILGTDCGSTTSKLLTSVTTTTGGKFSYAASPLRKTSYTVKLKNATSPAATVRVAPRLQLTKVSRRHYKVSVFAAQTFAGQQATFQRYRKATKRWVQVKRVRLKANTTGVAPTVVTSARFRSGITTKLQVRVVLGPKQVGLCYAAGRSNAVRS